MSQRHPTGHIAIVQTGQPPETVRRRHGDFPAWFIRHMELDAACVRVYRADAGCSLPRPGSRAWACMAGVIVTGSPAMVTERQPWSVAVEKWLGAVLEKAVPVLGVCYGHQLLAQAAGGRVSWNPNGRQIGQINFCPTPSVCEDPLFADLLNGRRKPLSFYVTHLQAVQSLPRHSCKLGVSPRDANHAFRLGTRAWGVQFHPEFTADITRAFIQCRAVEIAAEGLCPQHLMRQLDDHAETNGRRLLRRFAQLCFKP